MLGSLGGFNDAAETLIADFGRAKAMSACSSFSYAYHATLLRRKLAFVVQKCQANAIIRRGTCYVGDGSHDDVGNILLVVLLVVKMFVFKNI